MKKYRMWADYGPDGILPEDVTLEYDPALRYDFPESVERSIERVWTERATDDGRLFDGRLLNLRATADDGSRLRLGPSRFKHYFVRRQYLSGNAPQSHLSAPQRELLRRNVRVLSSICAVVVDGSALLGVKDSRSALSDGGTLSFPGGGFLDPDADTVDEGAMKPTSDVVAREVNEELNVADRIAEINCLGVFEDVSHGSHLHPALFSVAQLDAGWGEAKRRIVMADDRWEFTTVSFVPVDDRRVVESLVEFGLGRTREKPSTLTGAFPRGAPEGITDQSILLLLLLGRRQFGERWYERVLERYAEDLEIRSESFYR